MAEEVKTLGLSKKTRVQLIEIILRKDEIHKKLNEEIATKDEKIKNLKDYIASLKALNHHNNGIIKSFNETIEHLEKENSELKEGCDELVDKQTRVLEGYDKYLKALWFILLISITCNICQMIF